MPPFAEGASVDTSAMAPVVMAHIETAASQEEQSGQSDSEGLSLVKHTTLSTAQHYIPVR